MTNNKLSMVNVGCGYRFSDSGQWKNFDFQSRSRAVTACNLLAGIPLPSNAVDFVYSSHVLEHFTVAQAKHLLQEMVLVLKPGGYIRWSFRTWRTYAAITSQAWLSLGEEGGVEYHRWATIVLLDQLVLQSQDGEMARMHREVRSSGDGSLRQHIISRTGFDVASLTISNQRNLAVSLAGINWPILKGKALSVYIAFVKRLLPSNLHSLIIDAPR